MPASGGALLRWVLPTWGSRGSSRWSGVPGMAPQPAKRTSQGAAGALCRGRAAEGRDQQGLRSLWRTAL